MRCETADEETNGRLVSPSAERNKGPIADVLRRVLPQSGRVLEISSGTGQHVLHFAKAMPHLDWQPSEQDAECLTSIAAWLAAGTPPSVAKPIRLDVHDQPWPVTQASAVVCINMIHIAPWSATDALFRGARAVLQPGGILFLYGPYRQQGRHTAPSNEAFDRHLRAQNAEWGIRNLEDVAQIAETQGFELVETIDMPANNLSVIFKRNSNP
jgi:SAM-dependent methyltransferase